MKQIVHVPHPVLTTPAKSIVSFDKKVRKLVQTLKDTLEKTKHPKGVGLAAPQIGEPWQVFVIKPTDKSSIREFLNPNITKYSTDTGYRSDDTSKKLEGCLSITDIWGKVERSRSVTLVYQDINGNKHEELFTGFPAVIIQHEVDHLNGTLFTHRVIKQNGPLFKTVIDKNGKETLKKIELV